jgi:hypothetical protein
MSCVMRLTLQQRHDFSSERKDMSRLVTTGYPLVSLFAISYLAGLSCRAQGSSSASSVLGLGLDGEILSNAAESIKPRSTIGDRHLRPKAPDAPRVVGHGFRLK